MCETPAVLGRYVILTAALLLGACSPAATLAQTSSTPPEAPVSTEPPADPALVPEVGVMTDVPVPTLIISAWTPAPRTKTTACISLGGLPDPACTPGAIDSRVTDATTGATICTSGYTATVRPPVSVTNRIKRAQMVAYGLQGQPLAAYELDHLISLELGGSPDDVANLWPEPWTGDGNAHQKDAVETHLKREICSGAVSLVDAQRMIATDWLAVYLGNGLQPAP